MMELNFNRAVDWELVWEWGFKIGTALLILIITHFIAKAVKWTIARLVDRISVLQRQSDAEPGETVGGQIGTLAYWIVWLVGLVVAVRPLELSNVLTPVEELTTTIFGFLPNVIGAGLLLFFGIIVANVIRRIVETALKAANVDGWLARAGSTQLLDGKEAPAGPITRTSISSAIGVIVFVLIVIPFATASLQTLQLTSISEPLVAILDDVAFFIPRVITAALILGLAYVIAGWVKTWLEQVLEAVGVDNALSGSGLVPENVRATRVIGAVALTAIMLVAATAAIEVLEIRSVQAMITEVVGLGGRVIFGLVIIAAGVLLGGILRNIMASSTGETGMLTVVLKWLVVALFAAMGLKFMSIADEIVVIAFASVLGSAAIAAAIAFGIGGRQTAHELLQRWKDGSGHKTSADD